MQITLAHVVVQELSNMSPNAAAAVYLRMGYTHVLPLGFDHILFILSLLLLSTRLKPLLWQATAFTVAHSLSLALAMYNIVNVPSSVIEPLISFSICLVALENIFFPKLRPSRIVIVFIFGLVHGLGFAEALTSIGLSKSNYLFALLFFNVGVELAQVTVIVVGYFLLIKTLGQRMPYRARVMIPASSIIVCISLFWTIQRLIA